MTNTTVVIPFPTHTEPEPPPTPPPRVYERPITFTTDRATERFVQLRDKIAEIKKRQQQELAPLVAMQATLEGWLMEDLNDRKVESMRAATGTIFKTVRTSATVKDWPATLEYIKTNEAWELLEARVSKLAVEQILTDTGQPVPGVETSREFVLNVRRPKVT